jgi:hypothetical protein
MSTEKGQETEEKQAETAELVATVEASSLTTAVDLDAVRTYPQEAPGREGAAAPEEEEKTKEDRGSSPTREKEAVAAAAGDHTFAQHPGSLLGKRGAEETKGQQNQGNTTGEGDSLERPSKRPAVEPA